MAVPLAACGDGGDSTDQLKSGEVLEGTISDAMLPLDRVQSQAPQADPEPRANDASKAPTSVEGKAKAKSTAKSAESSTNEPEPAEPSESAPDAPPAPE
jgi:hypothetical protein